MNILDIDKKDYKEIISNADSLIEVSKYTEAKDLYLYLIDKNPYDHYVKNRLYFVYNKLIEKQKIEVKNNPENIELGFDLAWNLYEYGNFDEALAIAIELIWDEDKVEDYIGLMGKIFSCIDKFEESLEMYTLYLIKIENKEVEANDFEKVNEIKAEIYYRIALANYNLDRYEEAIDIFYKVNDIIGERYINLNALASTLIKAKRYEEAIKVSDRSIEINRYQAEAHINLAKALKGLGFYMDAIESCKTAIKIYRYNKDPYEIQLEIYSSFKDYNNMLEIIKTIEVLDIMDNKFKIYKAELLTEKKLIREAKGICSEIIGKIEKNEIDSIEIIKNAYYRYSYICNSVNNLEKALIYINKAIELDKDNLENYYLRNEIYEKLG